MGNEESLKERNTRHSHALKDHVDCYLQDRFSGAEPEIIAFVTGLNLGSGSRTEGREWV